MFALGEFRALWSAQVLSIAGDQLARVALTLLVFERTRSSLLAAVTFAVSVVPAFVGGIALSGLADRLPRRTAMIACDLVCAALVTAMALPSMPVAALLALLFLVTMISAPFTSARAALFPEILRGDLYVLGTAVTLTTSQFAQVLGFAAGGVAVGFFGVRVALLVDAATFVLSALITWAWVATRAAAGASHPGRVAPLRGIRGGLRLVFTEPGLLTPMLLGWLVTFLDVHEGVAAPLAVTLGGGAVTVGLILAAGALGTCVGAIGFSRLVRTSKRDGWVRPLAITSCAVLCLFALQPALPWALAILAASGLLSCYQVAANAAFVRAAPISARSRAFGVAQAGMSLGQGTAMVIAGALAQHHLPAMVIAASGALGTAAAIAITGRCTRT